MPVQEISCANVKSRKYKNSQCPYAATHGEFCSRHYKNPLRFLPKKTECDHVHTRKEHAAATKLQRFWKSRYPFFKRILHGPAFYDRSLSSNRTEIYSLEAIEKISDLFFFSYLDSKQICWAFDLRSLNHLLMEDTAIRNPYTREPFPEKTMTRLHERVKQLSSHKISIFYPLKDNLNTKQIWNQRVLDIFLKLDALGYRASTQWFETLTLTDHEKLYKKLFVLWFTRLGLTHQEKDAIVPGYQAGISKLFRWNPDKLQSENHDITWWKKNNLELLKKFISSSEDKTKQSLGALYVLMGLAQVVPAVGEAYPWILEAVY
jgi:hypothetical protein